MSRLPPWSRARACRELCYYTLAFSVLVLQQLQAYLHLLWVIDLHCMLSSYIGFFVSKWLDIYYKKTVLLGLAHGWFIVYIPVQDCVPKYSNLDFFTVYMYGHLFSLLMDILFTPNRQLTSCVSLAPRCLCHSSRNTFHRMFHQFPCCLLREPLWIRATSFAQAVANSEPLRQNHA